MSKRHAKRCHQYQMLKGREKAPVFDEPGCMKRVAQQYFIELSIMGGTDAAIFNFPSFHGRIIQGPWLVSGWKEVPHNDEMCKYFDTSELSLYETYPVSIFFIMVTSLFLHRSNFRMNSKRLQRIQTVTQFMAESNIKVSKETFQSTPLSTFFSPFICAVKVCVCFLSAQLPCVAL